MLAKDNITIVSSKLMHLNVSGALISMRGGQLELIILHDLAKLCCKLVS